MSETLLWLDVETTGLDPAQDELLEIAAVPTHFDADFTPFGEPFTVLLCPSARFDSLNPHVQAMHAATSLWEHACRYGLHSGEALSLFHSALIRWGLRDCETVYLAGRSVHFDRSWLEPRDAFVGLSLSHRLFDLTPIKAFTSLAGIPIDVPEDAHRALADVEADIALARSMVGAFRRAASDLMPALPTEGAT